jgi:hypothetical protein
LQEEAAGLGVEAVLRLKDDVLVEVGNFHSSYPTIVKYEEVSLVADSVERIRGFQLRFEERRSPEVGIGEESRCDKFSRKTGRAIARNATATILY